MRSGWRAAWCVGLAFVAPARAAGAEIVPSGPDFQVNTYTTDIQLAHPGAVCRDAAGDTVVVWDGALEDGGAFGVFGQRYDRAGVAQGSEFQVNAFTTGSQRVGAVGCEASGAFDVVWESQNGQDGDGHGVFGRRFDAAGAPRGTEFQVNTTTTNDQLYPSVGVDAAGGFVVVWQSLQQDGDASGVFGQRFTPTGNPLGTEFQVNTYTTSFQQEASVAVDPAGNFVVVWRSQGVDGSYNGVAARRYASSGLPAGTEFVVNSYTTKDQFFPAVAADRDGNVVVTWSSVDQDGSGPGIFAQRFAADGSRVGSEFQVNTHTGGEQEYSTVASDALGNFVVAWSSVGQDGSARGVFAQRFDRTGARHGTEFQVNTYTPGNQGYTPAVASDKDGDFVVVWNSYGQDGSNQGVFARRFADPCGDGVVGAGEECDDGDRVDGACCDAACRVVICQACEQCDTTAGCVAKPRLDCRHPTKAKQASLTLVDKSPDKKDRVAFGWMKGALTQTTDLGNPPGATDYAFCVFDRAGGTDRLVLRAGAPHGGSWTAKGSGFRYRDKGAASDGLTGLVLKAGKAGKASATVAGKGPNLHLSKLGLTAPVTAELEAGAGACFAGTFGAPKKNTATLFKAKGS
jgi:hypothetical protein